MLDKGNIFWDMKIIQMEKTFIERLVPPHFDEGFAIYLC